MYKWIEFIVSKAKQSASLNRVEELMGNVLNKCPALFNSLLLI